MRLLRLKTPLAALTLSIVTFVLHLSVGFLLIPASQNQALANAWQYSFKIYWPAFVAVQLFGANMGSITFFLFLAVAVFLELWLIFAGGLWFVRTFLSNPDVNKGTKIAVGTAIAVVAVFFWILIPGGYSQTPLERAMVFGDPQTVKKLLKEKPSLANQRSQHGNDTPLYSATMSQNPKTNIDLLIASGADINARSGAFNLTPLQHAAWSGNVEAVKALLAHKPDVNATTENGETALTYAFMADSKEIFSLLLENGADINHGRSALAECMGYAKRDSWPEFLLSKGADPNRQGTESDRYPPIIDAISGGNSNYVAPLIKYHVDLSARYVNGADDSSPLELAMDEGHPEIALMIWDYALQRQTNTASLAAARGDLDALRGFLQKNPQAIEEKDELGLTPLAWAAEYGQKSSAELLISLGANPNSTTKGGRHPIDWAASAGHLSVVELLADKGAINLGAALYVSIQQKHISVARYLLDHGANPNTRNPWISPLHLAALQGNVEAARLLLEHGADVKGVEQNGRTPLQYAAGRSSSEMVELLFKNGAVIPNSSNSWTIFQEWALGDGDTNVAACLLAHGAKVNARDYEGRTPLHFAIRQGTFQAVEWLLNNGADVKAKDKNGSTPLSLGKSRNRGRRDIAEQKKIADLLQNYRSKAPASSGKAKNP